nr:immunoglobulin light chain junction region [Macaca mulatta]
CAAWHDSLSGYIF